MDATRHSGHVAEPRVAHPRRRWRTERKHLAGRHGCPRGSTQTPVWGATLKGVAIWRAHWLVGPGKYIGAVTQMRTAPLSFIVTIPHLLFRVRLCPTESYLLRVTWRSSERWIDGFQVKHVDAMDNEST